MKVRTLDSEAKVAKAKVAIPIPSGEGQNLKNLKVDGYYCNIAEVAIPIPSGEGQNSAPVEQLPEIEINWQESQYLYLLVKVRTTSQDGTDALQD